MEGRNGILLLSGYRVSAQEDERLLDMSDGDSDVMQILSVTELYASKTLCSVCFATMKRNVSRHTKYSLGPGRKNKITHDWIPLLYNIICIYTFVSF